MTWLDQIDDLEAKGMFYVEGRGLGSVSNVDVWEGLPRVQVFIMRPSDLSSVIVHVVLTPAGNALVQRGDDFALESTLNDHEKLAVGVAKRWRDRPARFVAPACGAAEDLRASRHV